MAARQQWPRRAAELRDGIRADVANLTGKLTDLAVQLERAADPEAAAVRVEAVQAEAAEQVADARADVAPRRSDVSGPRQRPSGPAAVSSNTAEPTRQKRRAIARLASAALRSPRCPKEGAEASS
jgi:hypothetical protein